MRSHPQCAGGGGFGVPRAGAYRMLLCPFRVGDRSVDANPAARYRGQYEPRGSCRMMARQGQEQSDLKIGLVGLGLGLIWVLIVGAFAYWLAAY
jgi:hypothetical protein